MYLRRAQRTIINLIGLGIIAYLIFLIMEM